MNISAISMVNRMPSFAGKKCPTHYEKGPDGKTMGVWTRDGGSYAFFTPASAIDTKAHKTHTHKNVESDREYYERKLYSPEWVG